MKLHLIWWRTEQDSERTKTGLPSITTDIRNEDFEEPDIRVRGVQTWHVHNVCMHLNWPIPSSFPVPIPLERTRKIGLSFFEASAHSKHLPRKQYCKPTCTCLCNVETKIFLLTIRWRILKLATCAARWCRGSAHWFSTCRKIVK